VRGYTTQEIEFKMEKAGFKTREIRTSGPEFIVISEKTGAVNHIFRKLPV
jgi:hypothetical protein